VTQTSAQPKLLGKLTLRNLTFERLLMLAPDKQSTWSQPLDDATSVAVITAGQAPNVSSPLTSVTNASCQVIAPCKQASCNCLQLLFQGLCTIRCTSSGATPSHCPSSVGSPQHGSNGFAAALNTLNTLRDVQNCQFTSCHSDHETVELIILSLDQIFRRLQNLLGGAIGAEAIFTDLQLNLGGHTVLDDEPLFLVRRALLSLVREKAQQAVNETKRRMTFLGTNLGTSAGADLEEALSGNMEKMYTVKLRMAGMRLDSMLQQLEWRLH